METSKMTTKKMEYVLVVFVIPSVYYSYSFQKVFKYRVQFDLGFL